MSADPYADAVIVKVDVIDVAEAARKIYGPDFANEIRPGGMPEHDYRFHLNYGDGGRITFGCNSTATDVAEYLKREGITWSPESGAVPS